MNVPQVGRGLIIASAVMLATVIGCSSQDAQRLDASGTLFAEDGVTTLAEVNVDDYELAFFVAGEVGEVAIYRSFRNDGSGNPIRTDVAGNFSLNAENLALSYDWERDELVCNDVCVAWDSVCYEVTEEVCLDTCSEQQCGEDCWDDCTVECWDETVCDDYECWTERACEESCSEVCESVCDTVEYACNCYLDTSEVCEDECVSTVEECDWVTRYYTSYPNLQDIVSTQATIWLDGEAIVGAPVEAFQQQSDCGRGSTCEPVNLWVQKDKFVMPPSAE